ncbi:MAG: FAD-dependent monooxygenase [Devosia sp.]
MTAAPLDDLLVIGAGLAGIGAATAAARRGYAVTLISAHDRHPPDFRGEKLGEAQMATLERLGLGDAARQHTTPFDGCWQVRRGRITGMVSEREYSSNYSDLVNGLMAAIPAPVRRITGRVADLATGPHHQAVTLADGRVYTGRLLVIATGLSEAILKLAGLERQTISAGHSVACGYDIEEPAADFRFPSLVWGPGPTHPRLSYLTLFPIGGRMRGNLFTYHTVGDPWTRLFRDDPETAVREAVPELEASFGRMTIRPGAVARPIDLKSLRNTRRHGVVALGDAFSVVCPTTGYGMGKALTDADRLVNLYLPLWLATPGMEESKLAAFYADPIKTALDARAMAESVSGRKFNLDPAPYWRVRRLSHAARQRLSVLTSPAVAARPAA